MILGYCYEQRHEPFHALTVVHTQSVPPSHYPMPISLKPPHLSFLSTFPPLLPFHSIPFFLHLPFVYPLPFRPSLSPSSPLPFLFSLRRNSSQWLCVDDEPLLLQRPTKYLSSLTRTRYVVHMCYGTVLGDGDSAGGGGGGGS